MQGTGASIVDGNKENFMFTYSEEEKQQNEVNSSNSSLVFTPKFIVIDPKLLKILTPLETIIYSFIDFFTTNASKKFYFTNAQIAEMFNCSERTVTSAIKKLREVNLLKIHNKIKAGGGTIRFVTPSKNSTVTLAKVASPGSKSCDQISNKINNNKINIYIHTDKRNFIKLTEVEYNKLMERYPKKYVNKTLDDLNNYIGSKGKKYKSHYYTMLSWLKKMGVPENPKYL